MNLQLIHDLSHLITVFIFRHWLYAFLNAGLTALCGLGLIRAAQLLGWPRFSPIQGLRLRRLVLLTAMLKGAFYLLHGSALTSLGHKFVRTGIQFPGPDQWIGMAPMSTYNIWHPTSASALVTILVAGLGIAFLFWRVVQLLVSQRQLHTFAHMQDAESDPRLSMLLHKAAHALHIKSKQTLPQIVLVKLPFPTPLLLGLRRPLIVIEPLLAQMLTDDELEMALRHELAHCLRRDQWWRWLQTWLEDVGRLSGLSGLLGTRALMLEEEICDRMAVHTPSEVLSLARALTKVTQFSYSINQKSSIVFPHVPALVGKKTPKLNEASLLPRRLLALSVYTTELASGQAKCRSANPSVSAWSLIGRLLSMFVRIVIQGAGWLLFGLLLLAILYVKFNCFIGRF